MKRVLTLLVILCSILNGYSQTENVSVKKYAKINNGEKYIISESIFTDGHKETYVTSVPLDVFRQLRSKTNTSTFERNIEWDENSKKDGFQTGFENLSSIENAFNNAIRITEKNKNYKKGSLGRISLEKDFLNKEANEQSYILLNEVINAVYTDASILKNNIAKIENCDSDLSNVNNGIFLSNNENEISFPHIKAIYNAMFADQYTGWYNRNLLLQSYQNILDAKLNGQFTINTIQDNLKINEMLKEVIADPTYEQAAIVSLELSDPINNEEITFEINQEVITIKNIQSSVVE